MFEKTPKRTTIGKTFIWLAPRDPSLRGFARVGAHSFASTGILSGISENSPEGNLWAEELSPMHEGDQRKTRWQNDSKNHRVSCQPFVGDRWRNEPEGIGIIPEDFRRNFELKARALAQTVPLLSRFQIGESIRFRSLTEHFTRIFSTGLIHWKLCRSGLQPCKVQ